jgi:hypothetical protein
LVIGTVQAEVAPERGGLVEGLAGPPELLRPILKAYEYDLKGKISVISVE